MNEKVCPVNWTPYPGFLRRCYSDPLNLLLQLVDTLLQALPMRLNGRRSQRPFRWGKGQNPETRVDFGWRCWCQHPQGSALRGHAAVLIGNLTSEVNAIMTSQGVDRPLWSRTTID